MKFFIKAEKMTFEFENLFDSAAWYDFDGAISVIGNSQLKIDADRDVYAIFKNIGEDEIWGVVIDGEDNILADNEGIEPQGTYGFKECDKDHYIR